MIFSSVNRLFFIVRSSLRADSTLLSGRVSRAQTTKTPQEKPIETGIFIPYAEDNREAGGVILYVRQKNFILLVKEFLGLNYHQSEGPTKRDCDILAKIDEIPSLDPFLLKLALNPSFPEIDPIYFDISDVDEALVRNTISAKVLPIVRKAMGGKDAEVAGLDRFINAIWDPSASEASLFVSAFGISSNQTNETMEAWRGIAFYEWSYGRIVTPVSRLLGWLMSDLAKPIDAQAIGNSARQQLDASRISIGRRISDCARGPDRFFRDYAGRHNEFLDKNDPGRFREFLSNAQSNYWKLAWTITSLMHIIGIFSRTMLRSSGGQLSGEVQYQLFRDIDLALTSARPSDLEW